MFDDIVWMSIVQALATAVFFSVLAIVGLRIVSRQIKESNFSGADVGFTPASASVKIKVSIGALIFLISAVMIVVTMVAHWWIVVAPIIILRLYGSPLGSIGSDAK